MKSICHEVYLTGRHLTVAAFGYSPKWNEMSVNWLRLLQKQALQEFAQLPNKSYKPGTLEAEMLLTIMTWSDRDGCLSEMISKLENLNKLWKEKVNDIH